ncbi:MAG: hypothetical protein U9P71_00885 [Campylobacterota bacterium]|nr:hypothetical protein [Campylobacterota bacterium]
MTFKPLKIMLIAAISVTALFSDNLSWVDQQITAILPKRVGIADSKISQLSNPIRYQKLVVKDSDPDTKTVTHTQIAEVVKPLKVAAILNNSALIDKKWLKINDTIRGYKVKRINSDSVLLKSKDNRLKLFVKEKNNKIKIQIN